SARRGGGERRGGQEPIGGAAHVTIAPHHEHGCGAGGGREADGSGQQQTEEAPSHRPDATFALSLGSSPSAGLMHDRLRNRTLRSVATLALIAIAGLGLAACGSSNQATQLL